VSDLLASEGAGLRNLYWSLRLSRGVARSTLYRKILREKKRLLALGLDAERLRLYCLLLANPRRECRQKRFDVFSADLLVSHEFS